MSDLKLFHLRKQDKLRYLKLIEKINPKHQDEIADIVPKYGYLDDIVVVRWIVSEINKELPEIGMA